jgi:hypothetical protein
MASIKNNEPIFGYVNGLDSKQESPYGAIPGQNPNPMEFVKYLNTFFDGSKQILAKPESKSIENVKPLVPESQKNELLEAMANVNQNQKQEPSKVVIKVPTVGACESLNFRLYVKE